MKILVTGGLGFVGSKAVSALADAGHCVRVLDVAGHPLRDQFARLWASMGDVEIVEGDVAVYRDVEGAVAGCDRVLHTAALINSIARYSDFHRVNTPIGDAKTAKRIVAEVDFCVSSSGEGRIKSEVCRRRRTSTSCFNSFGSIGFCSR
jgi:uncharacterized protein YbjT (DUF2867 family)